MRVKVHGGCGIKENFLIFMDTYEDKNKDFETSEDLGEDDVQAEIEAKKRAEENFKLNDKKIKAEKKKLLKILSKIDENLIKICDSLIENIAFMSVTLDGLIATIKAQGVKEFYKNGQNQFGFKKSVEIEVYNAMQKNYQSSMKLLIDMLSKDDSSGDEAKKQLEKYFARGRN